MIYWQEIIVAMIVLGAVIYLILRRIHSKKKPACASCAAGQIPVVKQRHGTGKI